MSNHLRLQVVFFKTEMGKEPVREWLKSLPRDDRKTIGEDVKTVQFGWPKGMPVVRKIDKDLWEVRSRLQNRIARILFTIDDCVMVLIHGFIKKIAENTAERFNVSEEPIGSIARLR